MELASSMLPLSAHEIKITDDGMEIIRKSKPLIEESVPLFAPNPKNLISHLDLC